MRMQTIGCGYCWACKLKNSAEWATRIALEAAEHEHNYWITLTYNEEHLPIYEQFTDGESIFENDGTWNGTLEPEDVTKFINTMRKHYERKPYYHTGIKYFYCGEYGETTGRPHYHMCLFNVPLDQSMFYDFHVDNNHKLHWKSKEIEHWWSEHIGENDIPIGMVDVTELEWSNAAYTARYTMKKIFNEPKSETEYAKIGKIKEFVRMSKRPGIGMNYFNQNMDKIYDTDELVMKTVKGNIGSFKPPKAFDRKFKELHPDQWELITESRRHAAERSNEIQKTLSDYTDKKLLEIKAENIMRIGKQLPRILEA